MIYDKSVAINILRHAEFDPHNDDGLTWRAPNYIFFLTRLYVISAYQEIVMCRQNVTAQWLSKKH